MTSILRRPWFLRPRSLFESIWQRRGANSPRRGTSIRSLKARLELSFCERREVVSETLFILSSGLAAGAAVAIAGESENDAPHSRRSNTPSDEEATRSSGPWTISLISSNEPDMHVPVRPIGNTSETPKGENSTADWWMSEPDATRFAGSTGGLSSASTISGNSEGGSSSGSTFGGPIHTPGGSPSTVAGAAPVAPPQAMSGGAPRSPAAAGAPADASANVVHSESEHEAAIATSKGEGRTTQFSMLDSGDEEVCACDYEPPVFIVAVDPEAMTWTVNADEGATTAAFLVFRGGNNHCEELTVNYAIDGNAVEGIDYEPLPDADYGTMTGTVTIPEGEFSVGILIEAIPSNGFFPLTLSLSLTEGDGYVLSDDDSAFVSITHNYYGWVDGMPPSEDPPVVYAGIEHDFHSAELPGDQVSTGGILVWRDGRWPGDYQAIDVEYDIQTSSTASTSDYETLSGIVTIPANGWVGELQLTPSNDLLLEGDEFVDLNFPVHTTPYQLPHSFAVEFTIHDDEVNGPVANDDEFVVSSVGPTTIPVQGVLCNDDSYSNFLLTAVGGTFTTDEGGTVVLSANGSFIYVPPASLVDGGVDSFEYTATLADPAGARTDTAEVTLVVTPFLPPSFVPNAGGGMVGGGPGGNVPSNVSCAPVRYADGVIQMSFTDIASSGFGIPFAQSRSWSNDPSYAAVTNSGNGNGWIQLPGLAEISTTTLALVSDGTTARYFDYATGTFLERYFGQSTIAFDSGNDQYVLRTPEGLTYRFEGFDSGLPRAQRGAFVSRTDSYGNVTEVISRNSDGRPTEIRRGGSAEGQSVTESWVSTYLESPDPNAGLLSNVTLRQRVGMGSWNTVRQVDYTYYSSSEAHGNLGDLKTAIIKDAGGNALDTNYYRYYQLAEANGFAGGLKFAFGSASFARLQTAVGNPFTASDSAVSTYADNYFEYDSQKRVVFERAQGEGCSTCSAGQGDFTFEYTTITNSSGFNSWRTRTIETLPDGNQNVVYTNAAGEIMLFAFVDSGTSNAWVNFFEYDSFGRTVLTAAPSAVSGFNDSYADLLHKTGGNFEYLINDAGVVTTFDYYTSTTATNSAPGGVTGFWKGTSIQKGESGSAVRQLDLAYLRYVAGSNVAVLLGTETEYVNTNGTGAQTTAYDYVPFSGTLQMESMTTTYATVTQNGPGTADVEVSFFDRYGQLVWTKDADGFLSYLEYDNSNGAVTKAIDDVNTSLASTFSALPSGWSTPSGGGLHLTTLAEVDRLGRTTKATDANENVTYTVYNDPNHEVRVYEGWLTSSNTPTNPTYIVREDLALSYTEVLTMSATPAVSSGRPTGAESVSSVQTLSRSYRNSAGQVTQEDEYFKLAGLTYSTSTSLGTEGEHFYRSRLGYDHRGRLSRTVASTGTITRTVYDGRSRESSIWIGTDDTPTSGWWSPDNLAGTNMVKVGENEYDFGGVGDDNLTRSTEFPDGGLVSSAANAARFVKSDGTSGGNWRGSYGADGYSIAQQASSFPAYADVSVTGHNFWTWEGTTSDVRALQKPGSTDRIAACWYSATSFTIDIDLTDGGEHKVSTYLMDYDNYLGGRNQRVEVLDASTNAVLDSRDISSFVDGLYLTWVLRGHVKIKFTNLASGSNNAIISGLFFDQATARSTDFAYDWRNRLVATKSGAEATESTSLNRTVTYLDQDNLGQIVTREQYDGDGVSITTDSNSDGVPDRPSSSLLRAQSKAEYDAQGRVFVAHTFAVDPAWGTVSTDSLDTKTWFDHRGQVVKTSAPGGVVTKLAYDGAGRITTRYTTDGGGDTTWADALTVTGDAVLEQVTQGYDAVGNVIMATTRQRFHDASGTGALGTPSSGVHARVSYVAAYYDKANRLTHAVDVGTNGASAYTRPSTPPSRSATTLVTSYDYGLHGQVAILTDPAGREARYSYDSMLRVTQSIENFVNGTPSDTDDKTIQYGYAAPNLPSKVTLILPSGEEVTQYVYGVSPTNGSTITSNDLVRAVYHPNKSTGAASSSEADYFGYNAVGETTAFTDRNGTVHGYGFDVVRRPTTDSVTTVGSGVDGAVRRLETGYDSAGRAYRFTSYDAQDGGSIVNQVRRDFNGLGQLTIEYQSHSGAVNTSTSPKVQYTYSEMASGANHSRPTSLVYPDGFTVGYNYASGVDNAISRLTSLSNSSTTLESYTYLGLGTVVVRAHPQPGVDLNYIQTDTEKAFGDAGDQYMGLDRFGRIVDQRWKTSSTDVDRTKYGYDRNSNRLWRQNTVSTTNSELYTYDGLNQLETFARGTLNSTKDAITGSPSRTQSWDVDGAGNFEGVNTNGTNQSRTHNLQNQLTGLGAATLTFDDDGNVTTDEVGRTLTWDAWNRLVNVSQTTGETSITWAQYKYDALGRRIASADSETWTDLYYSSNWQVLEERVGGTPIARNVWSPVYVDAMVLRDRDTNTEFTGMEERLYVMQDANWNVTGLVNTSGTVVERFLYDPYGRFDVKDGSWGARTDSSYGWQYLHQGGRWDAGAGLYHFRNRDFSPTQMRWMSNDPINFGGGDINLYRYERNEPTGLLDPHGLSGKGSMTYDLGGGLGTAYVEWFPDQGVAEMKVLDARGNELIRYRWDKSSKGIQVITNHGGKQLPGLSQRFLKQTSYGITNCQKIMITRAGGQWSKTNIPQHLRDAMTPTKNSRGGLVTGQALAGILGTTVIVGGVQYFYDQYVSTAETVGMDLATRAGLGLALQIADRDELVSGVGQLPGRIFDVVVNGNLIHIMIVEGEPGKHYITAWYTRMRWGIISGSYPETVDVIRIRDNYRVYNCGCR